MAFLKFLETRKMIPCKVMPEGNVVTLKFNEPQDEPKLSGFDLFLDAKAEINIGGNAYHGFTTLYRNDEATAAYNGYQLSNDESVYVAPTLRKQACQSCLTRKGRHGSCRTRSSKKKVRSNV